MNDLLYTEHETDDVDLETPPTDDLAVRRLMIALAIEERKAEQTGATLAAVTADYQARIASHEQRAQLIRTSLENYVKQHGKVSFPDVGSAYLTVRKPRPTIVDQGKLVEWAHVHAATVIETTERVPASVLPQLVEAAGGELPPGVDTTEASERLTIRKAA